MVGEIIRGIVEILRGRGRFRGRRWRLYMEGRELVCK